MMSGTITELISKVAAKHHIVLGNDDPILILHTVNELLLQENIKAQTELLEIYKSQLEEMTRRLQQEAKETAEKVLNVALSASKKIMEEKAEALSEFHKSQINATTRTIKLSLYQDAKNLTTLNLIASALSILSAATILLGLFYLN